jgi:hypothetical protein
MSKDRDNRHFNDGYREGKSGGDRSPPHSDPITTVGGLLRSESENRDRSNYNKGYDSGKKSSK